jgi:hypothetical protein
MPCDLNLQTCQNNGTCKNDFRVGFKCSCPNGFTGKYCEIGNSLREVLSFSFALR